MSSTRLAEVSSFERLPDIGHLERGFTLVPRSIWEPIPNSSSMLRSSLDDDEPRVKIGSLQHRCPCRRSALGGKRVDHVFFEIAVSSSCVASLMWTAGAFPFLASISSLRDQTSIPEGFVPPKFWPNPDGPLNLQPTVLSDNGLGLSTDWALSSTARPSSPKKLPYCFYTHNTSQFMPFAFLLLIHCKIFSKLLPKPKKRKKKLNKEKEKEKKKKRQSVLSFVRERGLYVGLLAPF